MNGFLVFFLLAALLLGGCSSSASSSAIPVATGTAPVAPLAETLPPYRLQVGDEVEISMLLNPELDEVVTVRPDGMVSTTVAQDVSAYGKTAGELQGSLIGAYKKYLTDPQLTVVVKKFTPSRIYVLGEVSSPGEMVSIGPNMTLLQALSRAGGLKNSGDEKNILIFRRGAGEEPEVYRADYASATKGNMPDNDIRLAAYDVVFVPRTGVANAYKAYQNIQQFLPSSLGLGYGM
ncbi:MAG: polysaccharide biosynthesis/export family protein [Micavibrio sp.]